MDQASGYTSFSRNFKSQNVIDNSPTNVRRVYENAPYLVLPNQKFNIKLGCLQPSLIVYIRILGELFGDPIPMDLTGYTINFYMYDKVAKLVAKGLASVSDNLIGEITYQWKDLDIQEKGIYNFEFEFLINSDPTKTFKLPTSDSRYEIIVI